MPSWRHIRQDDGMDAHQRRNLALAVAGTVLVVAYAAWAAVHILIVNPLAAMPGYTVGEIHDAMTAARQWSGPLRVYHPRDRPLLAIAALIVTVRRRDLSITSVASVYLALIVLGAPATSGHRSTSAWGWPTRSRSTAAITRRGPDRCTP
jgi:hypothetical protein